MDKAKAAVGDFLSKAGTHHTEINETANAPVVNEHIKPHYHENIQTAVDKETHQDHYHTTVQPIKDREVLPEKHQHQMKGVEHRTIEHDKPDEVRMRLEQERNQFRDTTTTHETQHTQKVHPAVGGERVHHHVHETVQPVIHRETIQPEVVHTTVPIHETHHNASRIHEAQTLPTMTMDEFKKVGGSLTGHETRHTERDGCPDPANPAGFSTHHAGHQHGVDDSTTGMSGNNNTLDGRHGGLDRAEADLGHRGHGTHTGGMSSTTGTDGMSGSNNYSGGTDGLPQSGSGYKGTSNPLGSTTNTSTNTTTSTKKPSLMDKLNPKKDSDGDGQAGFMK